MELKDISQKRQGKWKESDLYRVKEDSTKPKFYILDMFPYPSGSALHVGHPKGYIATDCLARKKMLEGFNVLHPMGFDTFGLGTEQYAIEHKMKPQDVSKQNIAKFIQQLENFGTTYDRSRVVNTADPKYFKRTQRIFLQMYNHYYDEKLQKAMPIASLKSKVESGKSKVPEGLTAEQFINSQRLAYVDYKPINRCPSCMTGLANEDLDDGKCERCGSQVEQKPMKQRVLRITKYAERLLEGLNDLQRDESMKDLERNWIGKSEGTEFKMKIDIDSYPTLNPSPLHGEGTRLPKVYTVGKNKLPSGNTMIFLARKLRQKQTVPELLLREILRNKQVNNLKFRRQHPLGNYIADFYCPEKNLVIELDGSIHNKAEQKKHDQERDAIMKQHNITVIRFTNDDIFEKIEEVIQTIIDISNQSPLSTEWRGVGGEVTNPLEFDVYTTRIDTVFGMSFVAIAPEHPLLKTIENGKLKIENWNEIHEYQEQAKHKTQLERTELQKEKTGVRIEGLYAINPFNNEKVPIFVADYVLANYGTGVVMAVPAHDERDFEFAKKYKLPITQSIMPDSFDAKNPPRKDKKYTERNTVHVILRNPKDKTVLIHFLKGEHRGNLSPKNFIIGGIEDGESDLEAAIREVKEETGYTNIKFIEKIPFEIQANFFAAHKDVNRKIHVNTLVFDLVGDERVEITEDEHFTKDSHEIHWLPYDKVAETINIVDDEMAWKYFYKGGFAYTEKGILINSGEFNGLISDEAIIKMQSRLAEKGIGGKKVNYKMQDRVFSRQRYRGEPFPILRTNEGGMMNDEGGKKIIPLDENDLPLLLPDVENYEPTGTEEGPLANITDWVNVTLKDGTKAKRETNTMPGRAGSSRYWLRYMDVNNDKALVGKDKEKYRGNVDVYVGGAEHITRHMIYGRFWQKFLYDIGSITHQEPFQEYHSVGLIMGEDGRKMSKRRGNVVNPDDIINEFGADVLRAYEMFMGPFDQSIAWSTNGIKGVKKFLDKIIALKDKILDGSLKPSSAGKLEAGSPGITNENVNKETLTIVNQTIKKVGEDIDAFRFNTGVSQLMILVNHLTECKNISRKTFEDLVILVSPFAPHLAEELWEQLGNEYSVFTKAKWPKYDEKYLVADTVTIAVQVNGKVRGTVIISKEAEESEVMQLVKADEKIAQRIVGKPKKVVYVKGKILNIVI